MPKWKLDPRTGQMVPDIKTGLEFNSVGGGIKITDNDLNTSFIILRSTDEIGYAQGQAARSVKLWDANKARQIAERVKRVMPNSKYTDWKKFCRTIRESINGMSIEDYKLLETLVNGYGATPINETVSNIHEDHLNEVSLFSVTDQSASDTKTIGMEKHGLHGLKWAIPSAAIAFVTCPPLALICLIGAVRMKSEDLFLKNKILAAFNPKTWLDYVYSKNPQKEKLKEKVKEAFAKNTRYYYSELANGEILKVPAASTVEARDMILAIEKADIIKRYEGFNMRYCHKSASGVESGLIDTKTGKFYSNICTSSGQPINMWCIKFSDGQVCYGFGEEGEKEQVKKDAEKSREAVVDYYKSVVLKDPDYKNKKKMKHNGIGKKYDDGMEPAEEVLEEYFVAPKVDDMFEIKTCGMYGPITNDNAKKFADPVLSAPIWRARSFPKIVVPIKDENNIDVIQFNLLASNADEAGFIIGRMSSTLAITIQKAINVQELYEHFKNNSTNANATNSYRMITLQINVAGQIFNLNVIDDRMLVNNNGQQTVDTNKIDQSIKNSVESCGFKNLSSSDYIFYSDARDIVRTLKNCVMDAYSGNTNISKDLPNEFSRMRNIEDYTIRKFEKDPDWKAVAKILLGAGETINDCKIINTDNNDSQSTAVEVKKAA